MWVFIVKTYKIKLSGIQSSKRQIDFAKIRLRILSCMKNRKMATDGEFR
jgi:hypothetical protein